jgi:hypothetical protein
MRVGVMRFFLVPLAAAGTRRKRTVEYVRFMEGSGNGGILGL